MRSFQWNRECCPYISMTKSMIDFFVHIATAERPKGQSRNGRFSSVVGGFVSSRHVRRRRHARLLVESLEPNFDDK